MFELSTIATAIVRRDHKGRFCKPFIALIADDHTHPRHYNHCVKCVLNGQPVPRLMLISTTGVNRAVVCPALPGE